MPKIAIVIACLSLGKASEVWTFSKTADAEAHVKHSDDRDNAGFIAASLKSLAIFFMPVDGRNGGQASGPFVEKLFLPAGVSRVRPKFVPSAPPPSFQLPYRLRTSPSRMDAGSMGKDEGDGDKDVLEAYRAALERRNLTGKLLSSDAGQKATTAGFRFSSDAGQKATTAGLEAYRAALERRDLIGKQPSAEVVDDEEVDDLADALAELRDFVETIVGQFVLLIRICVAGLSSPLGLAFVALFALLYASGQFLPEPVITGAPTANAGNFYRLQDPELLLQNAAAAAERS